MHAFNNIITRAPIVIADSDRSIVRFSVVRRSSVVRFFCHSKIWKNDKIDKMTSYPIKSKNSMFDPYLPDIPIADTDQISSRSRSAARADQSALSSIPS
jgi:hypothetical protein